MKLYSLVTLIVLMFASRGTGQDKLDLTQEMQHSKGAFDAATKYADASNDRLRAADEALRHAKEAATKTRDRATDLADLEQRLRVARINVHDAVEICATKSKEREVAKSPPSPLQPNPDAIEKAILALRDAESALGTYQGVLRKIEAETVTKVGPSDTDFLVTVSAAKITAEKNAVLAFKAAEDAETEFLAAQLNFDRALAARALAKTTLQESYQIALQSDANEKLSKLLENSNTTNQRLTDTNKALEDVRLGIGNVKSEVEGLRKDVDKTTTAVRDSEKAIGHNTTAVRDVEKALGLNTTAVRDTEKAVDKNTAAVTDVKNEVAGLRKDVDKLSQLIQKGFEDVIKTIERTQMDRPTAEQMLKVINLAESELHATNVTNQKVEEVRNEVRRAAEIVACKTYNRPTYNYRYVWDAWRGCYVLATCN